jgi:glycosyltransferase involved in cell wall biosynthesis
VTRDLVLDVYPALYPAGGIGRYVRDLANALATRPEAPPARFCYPRHLRGASAPPWPAARLMPLPLGWRRMRVLLTASARWGLRPDALYGRPAVLHSPAAYGPVLGKTKVLSTVHDLSGVLHPEWHPGRTVTFLRLTMPAAIRGSALVVCDSDYVRDQVIRECGADPARVRTVHLALSPSLRPPARDAALAHVSRRFGLEPPFVLHVGTIEPRKNHATLIAAFERLARAGFPGRLVLVGQDGWRVGPIERRLADSTYAGRVLRVRDANDEDLAALYTACTLFAFPSLDEGFGFPPLEALACGAPCLCSDRSSLPEIVSGVGRLLPAEDIEAWADAMIEVWRDEAVREAVAHGGPERARHFSSDAWVETMFAIYRELLAAA